MNTLKGYKIEELVERFKNGETLRSISSDTGIYRKTLSKLMKENGLKTKKERTESCYEVYDAERFKTDENHYYVAIDRKDETVKIYDVNNKSGKITRYLFEKYGIEPYKIYQSRKFYQEHKEYWYEKYFNFVLLEKEKKEILIPYGYWNNKENCFEEAKKYKNKHQLRINSYGCYKSLKRNGWLEEAAEEFFEESKLYIDFFKKNHSVYVYEINGLNACYVGRTNNITRRDKQHRKGILKHGVIEYDNLYKFCKDNNVEIPNYKILIEDIDAPTSQEQEAFWVNKYREDGCNVLNKAAVGLGVGSLGSVLKWTYEKCKEEALKYKTRNEFKTKNQSAYIVSVKNGWIDEFIPLIKKENGYWNNFENCKEEALKYYNISELALYNAACYHACLKNKFIDILFPKKVKKCPYCDYETNDIENQKGYFENHLRRVHNKTVNEYLKEYPMDEDYFKNAKDDDNEKYVVCQICGERLKRIDWKHLNKHNITQEEYIKRFGIDSTLANETKNKMSNIMKETNLHIENSYESLGEKEIKEYIRSKGFECNKNRSILKGREIDIYIPSLSVGIEFNGLQYHSEKYGHKGKYYHSNKENDCLSNGVILYQFFEDEYNKRREVLFKKIDEILGFKEDIPIDVNDFKIDCKVNDDNLVNEFIIKHSLFLYENTDMQLFVYDNNENVVGVFCFDLIDIDYVELKQFACLYNEEEMLRMILDYIHKHDKINKVITYAERRLFNVDKENIYNKLGFEAVGYGEPTFSYYFSKGMFRNCRVSKSYIEEFKDIDLEECDKIWNTGTILYELTKYTSKKFKSNNDKIWVAIDKKDNSKKFYDANNLSGALSRHLLKTYGVKTPTEEERINYFIKHYKYWFEDYFDFIEVEKIKKVKKRFTKPCGYWNDKEICFNEAKKYKNLGELITKGKGCYDSIVRHGWKEEVVNRFYKQFEEDLHKNYLDYNSKVHMVYAYEIVLTDKKVCYIGRTTNMRRRHNQHKNGCYSHKKYIYDNLYKFCKENNIDMPYPKILEENLTARESQEREEYWLNHYKNNDWKALNKGAVGLNKGSLGAKLKWTYEKCKEEAMKYKKRTHFRDNSVIAYNVCRKNKWLDDFFPK